MKLEEYEALGEMKRGVLTMFDREHMLTSLARFADGTVIVSVKVAPKNAAQTIRSRKANAYYHGVVLKLMAEHSGHTSVELHDAMCEMFIPSEKRQLEFVSYLTGEVITVNTDGRRSSRQSPTAFYDFVEQVRQWARDFLGVNTPDPDPEYWRKKDRAA